MKIYTLRWQEAMKRLPIQNLGHIQRSSVSPQTLGPHSLCTKWPLIEFCSYAISFHVLFNIFVRNYVLLQNQNILTVV